MKKDDLFYEVKAFLDEHRKAVFAFVDEHGYPTTSLLLYIVDDDLNVFFGTLRSFSKYEHIIEQPVVSLSVIEEARDPLKVVDIRGTAYELSEEDKNNVHEWFKTKNPSKFYIEKADDFTIFKLVPSFIRWLDARSGSIVCTDLDCTE